MTNDKQRERLVELFTEIYPKTRYIPMEECREKTADYLLANGVIVPPLKMGDKVWIIDWCYETNEYEVSHIRYNRDLNGQRYSYDALMVGKNGADIGFFDSDIGKWVFLTKEEAEQALNNVQNGNSCEGGVQG